MRHLPRLQALNKRLTHIQAALQESVLDDFKLLLGGSADARPSADSMERLGAGCQVVNALGIKVGARGEQVAAASRIRADRPGRPFHSQDKAGATSGATDLQAAAYVTLRGPADNVSVSLSPLFPSLRCATS